MLENVIGYEHKEFKSPIERFTNLSSWVLHLLNTLHKKQKNKHIFIEKDTHLVQKGQAYFKLLKTAVFSNTGYKKDLLVKQLCLALSKNWRR